MTKDPRSGELMGLMVKSRLASHQQIQAKIKSVTLKLTKWGGFYSKKTEKDGAVGLVWW